MVEPLSSIEDDVRDFLDTNFPLRSADSELAGSDSLIELGVIDSLGVLELIEFLEGRYEFEILNDELLPENFDSIDGITGFVARKVDGRLPPPIPKRDA